jgi:hypothetical protein
MQYVILTLAAGGLGVVIGLVLAALVQAASRGDRIQRRGE